MPARGKVSAGHPRGWTPAGELLTLSIDFAVRTGAGRSGHSAADSVIPASRQRPRETDMPTGQRLPVLRYGSALIVTAVATWARLMLDPVVGDRLPFVTFVLGVVFVAWSAGSRPAAATVVLSSLAADY